MQRHPVNYTYLFFITLTAALGGGLFGFDTAVISGTIGDVKIQFGFNAMLEGWFVSSALIGCVAGVAFAGKLGDAFGRRTILLLSALLFFVSAIGCMLSATGEQLILSRMVGGIGVGVASIISPLFISEVAPSNVRGRMVTLYQLAITIGIVTAYFSNSLIVSASGSGILENSFFRWIINEEKWRIMFGAETVPALLFLLLIFFIPRSPRWLMTKGRRPEAESILEKISPGTGSVAVLKIDAALTTEEGMVRELFRPGLRRALLIGLFLAVLSQFSGINVIIYYGPRILAAAGFREGAAIGSQVLIGLINVIFTVVAIWKIDSFGRKPLLLFGIAGCIFSHVIIAVLFMRSVQGFVLVGFLALFIASFALSLGPVTWVIIAEIYPTKIRGRAMSIATVFLWLANALIGQIFPVMLEYLGPAGTFITFAVLLTPAFFFVRAYVPETKHKSLEEIERLWGRGESKR